jgi:hypothetical protein
MQNQIPGVKSVRNPAIPITRVINPTAVRAQLIIKCLIGRAARVVIVVVVIIILIRSLGIGRLLNVGFIIIISIIAVVVLLTVTDKHG